MFVLCKPIKQTRNGEKAEKDIYLINVSTLGRGIKRTNVSIFGALIRRLGFNIR